MTTADSSKKSKIKGVYVFAGKDPVLVDMQCQKLTDALVPQDQRAVGLFKGQGTELSISQVLDELRTLPFLTERRVVLIKNADKFISEYRPALENYFQAPCPTGVLILTVTSWRSNTKLAKILSKTGRLIEVKEPDRRQIPGKLVRYANDAHGKKLDMAAAEILAELAGNSLTQFYAEIDKLALFIDTEKTITIKHIESLTGHNRLFNSFAVIDAVIDGNIGQAVERLRKMFDDDRSAQFLFVGAFAYHLRKMFNAKVLLEKGVSQSEVIKRLRIFGNQRDYFMRLKNISLKQIGYDIEQLAWTDYKIKTGRVMPKVAAEQLVFKLTGI